MGVMEEKKNSMVSIQCQFKKRQTNKKKEKNTYSEKKQHSGEIVIVEEKKGNAINITKK